jgi:signal transduction histidine kinase
MFIKSLKLLVAFFLIFILYIQPTFAKKKVKSVVIFFGHNASPPSYQNFMEGFRSTFPGDLDETYNLQVEYLDMGRSSDDSYAKKVIEFYNEKIKITPLNLLITTPPFSQKALDKYGSEALKQIPCIELRFGSYLKDSIPSVANGNKLVLKFFIDIRKTLKSAFELFPNSKEVYVLSGSSILDNFFEETFKESSREFLKDHSFKFISEISLDSTIQIAKKISGKSIVFVPMYLSDSKNNAFTTPEAMNIISANCPAPVFPVADSFVKRKGGIGGYIFSYIFLGKETGKITAEILKGKPLNEITFDQSSFYQEIYNWQELKKWNLLNSSHISNNAVYYDKEPNFFRDYKWYIAFILIFLGIESVLIIFLIGLIRRQKEVSLQKQENDILYRQLIREDRLVRMAELTASLAHELNQPLTAILYRAQAGLRFLESGKLNDQLSKEILECIVADDKRAGSLISSVRNLMKVETREMEEINLIPVIQDTINIFQAEANQQHIEVNFDPQRRPILINGDKIQLQQVLLNLFSNAAIAMENSLPESKKIEIQIVSKSGFVAVSVRDHGPGIDPAISENLFKPFITSHKKGFGIGLFISRSIIEKHNGEIHAENKSDGGAEFSFKLKMA